MAKGCAGVDVCVLVGVEVGGASVDVGGIRVAVLEGAGVLVLVAV